MSKLFSPLKIDGITLENRIVIPPMCQYSAEAGLVTDWHLMHYGCLSHSGAGLLIMEATSICPEGRLSPFDLGLWGDEQEKSLKGLIKSIRKYSQIPIAIQLVHAGRKGSMSQPWLGRQYVSPENGGWQPVSASPLACGDNYAQPSELTVDEIDVIIGQFAESAKRAVNAGIDIIEIHGAHGYLIHQFLSPLSNKRTDQYGGALENRLRFAISVFKAIRSALSKSIPVGIRISATDWVDGGWDLAQSLVLAKKLKELGCSFIDVSTAGLSDEQHFSVGPNYQVNFAQAIKAQTQLPTITVGLITDPIQAEAILVCGQADMVAVGRGTLFDPRWPWHAAQALGEKVTVAPQYLRSAPHLFKNIFK